MSAYLTDEEINGICKPLKQHAAQVRQLQRMGFVVGVRYDGSPLVSRSNFEAVTNASRVSPAPPAPEDVAPDAHALMAAIGRAPNHLRAVKNGPST